MTAYAFRRKIALSIVFTFVILAATAFMFILSSLGSISDLRLFSLFSSLPFFMSAVTPSYAAVAEKSK